MIFRVIVVLISILCSITLSYSAQLDTWSLSDTQTTYSNYSEFYANYTNNSVVITTANCSLYINRTGTLLIHGEYTYNSTNGHYKIIADNGYQNGHSDTAPAGTYAYEARCVDSIHDNLNNTNSTTINLYNTSINSSSSGLNLVGKTLSFTANFTNDWFPVSRVGLHGYEIGEFIWGTNDFGSNVKGAGLFDCESSGKEQCIVTGTGGTAYFFYRNGSQYATNTAPSYSAREIKSGDVNNNGYKNHVGYCEESNGRLRIMNSGGSTVWTSNGDDPNCSAFTFGDFDGDGYDDDIATAGGFGTTGVVAYNTSTGSSWSKLWYRSKSDNTEGSEIQAMDIDGNGIDEIFLVSRNWDGLDVYNGTSGSRLWGGTGDYAVEVGIDFNHDGVKEEIVNAGYVGLSGYNVRSYFPNGTYYQSRLYSYTYVYELEIFDRDHDGFKDDIVLGTYGNDENLRILSNTFGQVRTYAMTDRIYSIEIDDINSDGYEEIIIGTDGDDLSIFDRNLTLLKSEEINKGDIGNSLGESTGIEINDLNDDGIKDIIIASTNGYIDVYQEVNCSATFTDGEYALDWNTTSNIWELDRTFTSSGNYFYNITCSKGGYETSMFSNNITIYAIGLNVSTLSNDQLIYSNYSSITANFTLNNLTRTGATCTLYHNKTGIWKEHKDLTYNSTTGLYELITDGKYLDGHATTLPLGTYAINVSCNDQTFGLISNTTTTTVNEYNTSLLVNKSIEDIELNQDVKFTANFSSDWIKVSGNTYENYEIGRSLWELGDLDSGDVTSAVGVFDCENSGKEQCIVVGTYNEVLFFYRNTTLFENDTTSTRSAQVYKSADVNNDSFRNVVGHCEDGNSNLFLYNRTGDRIWVSDSTVDNDCSGYDFGDFDGDGLKDDLFTAGSSATTAVTVYNTSNGTDWNVIWNVTRGSSTFDAYEAVAYDITQDGIDDVLFGTSSFQTYAHDGSNGSLIVNSNRRETIKAGFDFNHDGNTTEFVAAGSTGAGNILYTFLGNGSILSSYLIQWNIIYELAVIDQDLDGFNDDIVIGGNSVVGIRILDNSTNEIETFSITDNLYTMLTGDVTNDGREEIIAGSDDGTVYILNSTADSQLSFEVGQGAIGHIRDESPGIDLVDLNNDGLLDILTASVNGYVNAFQDTKCIADFNDGIYNMTWNTTSRIWEFNRSFTTPGFYPYTLTCSKGGYETQSFNETLSIGLAMNYSYPTPLNNSKISSQNITINITLNNIDINNCTLTFNNIEYIMSEVENLSCSQTFSNLSHQKTLHDFSAIIFLNNGENITLEEREFRLYATRDQLNETPLSNPIVLLILLIISGTYFRRYLQ